MTKRIPIYVHKVEVVFGRPVMDSAHLFPTVAKALGVDGVMDARDHPHTLTFIRTTNVEASAFGERLRHLNDHAGIAGVRVTATDSACKPASWSSIGSDEVTPAINAAWDAVREGKRADHMLDTQMAALGVENRTRRKTIDGRIIGRLSLAYRNKR